MGENLVAIKEREKTRLEYAVSNFETQNSVYLENINMIKDIIHRLDPSELSEPDRNIGPLDKSTSTLHHLSEEVDVIATLNEENRRLIDILNRMV